MKYTLKNTLESTRARDYLEQLIAAGASIELKKLKKQRSRGQNAYLHVLLGAFGAHFGYTIDEAKMIYKQINEDIYCYTKSISPSQMVPMSFWRSSADLTTEQMTKSIDRFREFSAMQDYPLPPPTDEDWLRSLENSIEEKERYL